MSVQLLRRLFTVDQYYKMLEAGVLTENERVELIRGEIVKMSPIGIHHANCVKRLNELLFLRLAKTVTVGIQNPVRLIQQLIINNYFSLKADRIDSKDFFYLLSP
ncbi:MAG: Uma2 family endonuclease [Cyanobacteriota bacterium]|nr:Uma2 family endonuclease [Cyanobacteriota bacterium]